MKKLFIVALAVVATGKAYSQDWTPANTEYFHHQPVIVTPGDGTSAPSDAIVLFDGTNLDEWTNGKGEAPGWVIEDGAMHLVRGAGEIVTKRNFGDCQLHVEWKSPQPQDGQHGQGRGNSGIFLQRKYEVQVLDSYENPTYSNGQAASIYKQHPPLVNATRQPGEWQTYDIIYKAPVFGINGVLEKPATVTVIHNGVLVQNCVEIKGTTEYIGWPKYEVHGLLPIAIQDHGNPVSFRNIWIREL